MSRKHIAKTSVPHGVAAYPLSVRGTVISPQKICLQFNDVQMKVRAPGSKEGLNRTSHGTWSLPIDTQATDTKGLNLGVHTDLYPEIFKELLGSLTRHAKLHPEHEVLSKINIILKEHLNGQ